MSKLETLLEETKNVTTPFAVYIFLTAEEKIKLIDLKKKHKIPIQRLVTMIVKDYLKDVQ
jgi:hypothetical protein